MSSCRQAAGTPLPSRTGSPIRVSEGVLAPVPDARTPNAAELLGQVMFSNAAHQIEQPKDRGEMPPISWPA